MVAAARDALGHVDAVVANHARSSGQDLAHLTAAQLDLSHAVNTRASLLLTQTFAERVLLAVETIRLRSATSATETTRASSVPTQSRAASTPPAASSRSRSSLKGLRRLRQVLAATAQRVGSR